MIPSDVWPCAFLLSRLVNGRLDHQIGAFLVRADSHAEAERLAQEFAEQLRERTGFKSSFVAVNTNSGESAALDLENATCRVTHGEESTVTLTEGR